MFQHFFIVVPAMLIFRTTLCGNPKLYWKESAVSSLFYLLFKAFSVYLKDWATYYKETKVSLKTHLAKSYSKSYS